MQCVCILSFIICNPSDIYLLKGSLIWGADMFLHVFYLISMFFYPLQSERLVIVQRGRILTQGFFGPNYGFWWDRDMCTLNISVQAFTDSILLLIMLMDKSATNMINSLKGQHAQVEEFIYHSSWHICNSYVKRLGIYDQIDKFEWHNYIINLKMAYDLIGIISFKKYLGIRRFWIYICTWDF